MKDSLTKIRAELSAMPTEPASPVEEKLIEICDRLASQLQRIERKIDDVDKSTADARLHAMRF